MAIDIRGLYRPDHTPYLIDGYAHNRPWKPLPSYTLDEGIYYVGEIAQFTYPPFAEIFSPDTSLQVTLHRLLVLGELMSGFTARVGNQLQLLPTKDFGLILKGGSKVLSVREDTTVGEHAGQRVINPGHRQVKIQNIG